MGNGRPKKSCRKTFLAQKCKLGSQFHEHGSHSRQGSFVLRDRGSALISRDQRWVASDGSPTDAGTSDAAS